MDLVVLPETPRETVPVDVDVTPLTHAVVVGVYGRPTAPILPSPSSSLLKSPFSVRTSCVGPTGPKNPRLSPIANREEPKQWNSSSEEGKLGVKRIDILSQF